ncbi:MAG: TerB family tellurite resistance protein [Proteobacteria bacterium]|nr:TerB family tellurite resistance protein [Pseudomonadota bacterium]
MIKSLNNLFKELFDNNEAVHNKSHTIELATAVLMIEISLADNRIDEKERDTINKLLSDNFGLTDNDLNELINLAENEVDHAVSLYDFTRLINDNLNESEKLIIIENLWQIAYADSVLDKYEEYYIRKIADLLYVSHSNYIKAKITAAEKE